MEILFGFYQKSRQEYSSRKIGKQISCVKIGEKLAKEIKRWNWK